MDQPRVIGHVVSVSGFRLRVELAQEAKSSSRATPDGVQRAVAINSYLTFDLGAGTHAIGVLSDLDAKETYDPSSNEELTLQLTKPRRIASVQLLGTMRQQGKDNWKFDTGITVLPTLDTPAEVANPAILNCIFGQPPKHSRPPDATDDDYDYALPIGHQTGDESTIVKASFNDLFSRPLAIVGNTGSGKSYTVAALLRSLIDDTNFKGRTSSSPHVFVFDINGEYASAFLSEEQQKQNPRQPNEAYVNGKKLGIPLWLMNTEEICEWLSASEQTQQPVLKTWWSQLKSSAKDAGAALARKLGDVLHLLRNMRPTTELPALSFRSSFSSVKDYLKDTDIAFNALQDAAATYFAKNPGDREPYFIAKQIVHNAATIDKAIESVEEAIEKKLSTLPAEQLSATGDAPNFISLKKLSDHGQLGRAASFEDIGQVSQYLTSLRMRLKARLVDRRWAIFVNYESLGINGIKDWFELIGFGKTPSRITVLDFSMLSHEVLPFVCAVVGRVLLEARENLSAAERHRNPWVVVLEEAHNYVKPARKENEERGQSLSRGAFERIAKEGRKFGLSLIVASQRPSEISPTIISQCANFFSHRLQNPDDIEHFKKIIPRQAQRLLDQVTVLAAGEAIVFGSAVYVPARVQIAPPNKEPSSRTSAPYFDWKNECQLTLESLVKNWDNSPPAKPEDKTERVRHGKPAKAESADISLEDVLPNAPALPKAMPAAPKATEPARPDRAKPPRTKRNPEDDDIPF